MATYYVDDGGDGTTEDSWATADTSINDLDTEYAFASADIVYFGADSQCQATNSANLTITGPTSGAPVIFISATQGSSPASYAQATGNQIDTTEGSYSITFDGSFALYGIKVNSGANVSCTPDVDEVFTTHDCIFAPGANGTIALASSGKQNHNNLTIDLSADGTTDRAAAVINLNVAGNTNINGLSFVNAAYRTGSVFTCGVNNQMNVHRISGGDFSGFTNATVCELINVISASTGQTNVVMTNCKTAATWTAFVNTAASSTEAKLINCGSADQPVSLYVRKYEGDLVSSSSIYRSNGAEFEGIANAWLITTTAICTQDAPFCTEWIYSTIGATGSKTFDLYVTNDTADLNDDEIWLEVEYKADASSGKWTLITDKPTNRTTTPAAQTDDTGSTWNGTGPSFTYKQKLSVTATVNTTGQFRARVCVGKASVASSSYLYVDPLVTVS